MSRRTSTLSPAEMSTRNIEMAVRPPKVSSQTKEDARALHILGGIYEPEAEELAAARHNVRRLANKHACKGWCARPEHARDLEPIAGVLEALGLLEAS